MSGKDMTLILGEAVLDHAHAVHARITNSTNVHQTINPARQGHGRIPVNTPTHMRGSIENFAQPLSEQIRAERDLAERGHTQPFTYQHGLIATRNIDGHVVCVEGAVVMQNEQAASLFTLQSPNEISRIVGGLECSLRDQVRLATYFVSLCCQAVSYGHCTVSFFADAVSFLSSSLNQLRITPSQDSHYQATQAENQATHTTSHAKPIHNSDSNQHRQAKDLKGGTH